MYHNTREHSAYSGKRQLKPLHVTRSNYSRMSSQSEQENVTLPQIHELKLQIQQVKDKTKKLRTVNSRITRKIESNTNAINKTFEQSADSPQSSPTIHQQTIMMLKKSIESAKANLESLNLEIEQAKTNDKYWLVRELEQEVAVVYVENKRHQGDCSEQRSRMNFYEHAYNDVYQVQSANNISQLRSLLREVKETNVSLRDKLSAYQKKKAKVQVELDINKNQKMKIPPKNIIEEAEISQAEDHKKISENCEILAQMESDHKARVEELNNIIQQQVQTLREYMEENKEELEKNIIEE